MAAAAKVISVQGEAFAKSPNGSMRRLAAGDSIEQGEVVITSVGGAAELRTADGQMMSINSQESFQFGPESTQATAPGAGEAALAAGAPAATVIQPGEVNVEQLLADEAAAAGLGGGGENGGNSFVRLMRISEELTPLSYEFPNSGALEVVPFVSVGGDDAPTGRADTAFADEDGEGFTFREVNLGGDGDIDAPATFTGKMNYDFGNDGPAEVGAFRWTGVTLPGGVPITSGGSLVEFESLNGGLELSGFIMVDGEKQEVFEVVVTNPETGEYSFTLFRPLDHLEQGEDNLDLVFNYQLKDLDGDLANGTLSATINDDTPVQILEDEEGQPVSVTATVDEDDINEGWFGNADVSSQGNRPNDTDKDDGSFTGDPANPWDSGPANVTGSVASLVSFGADGPGDNGFSLSDDFSGLEAQKLTSNGDDLSYEVIGNTLYAYVGYMQDEDGEPVIETSVRIRDPQESEGFPVEGRVVFTLQLESDGTYKFKLYDQLDHEPPVSDDDVDIVFAKQDQEFDDDEQTMPEELDPSETLPIDLSSVIVATDGDGDSITLNGNFTINITDDVPIEASWKPEIGRVEEEALHNGNRELFDTPTPWPDTRVATGSVASQVSVGTDERASFSLALPENLYDLPELYSKDVLLTYEVNEDGDKLTAKAGDRTVFTLELGEHGHYTFTLKDQLDHDRDDVQPSLSLNEGQRTIRIDDNGEDILNIDLSKFILASDRDGDTIRLNGNDLIIQVKDDVPVETAFKPEVGRVEEEALNNGNRELYDTPTPWPDTKVAEGSVAWQVSVGADERASFSLSLPDDLPEFYSKDVLLTYEVNEDGDKLTAKADGRTVFTLELGEHGHYTFTLKDQLDHDRDEVQCYRTNDNGEDILNIDLSKFILATDRDGDTIRLNGNDLIIQVKDDVPVEASCKPEIGRVEEEALQPGGNQESIDNPAWPDTRIAMGSVAAQVSVGADERASFSLSMPADLPKLYSKDVLLTYSVNGDGDKLTATAGEGEDARTVFTLELEDNGDYTFKLKDQLDHDPAGNGEDILDIDLSKFILATDRDGDTIRLNGNDLIIQVMDDVPTVLAPTNLAINGSFEAPNVGGWGTYTEIPGWVAQDGTQIEIQDSGAGGVAAQHGNQLMEMDSHYATPTNATVVQQVPTAGFEALNLSFWFASRAYGNIAATNQVEVFWGGKSLGVITDPVAGHWAQYSFAVPGDADGTTELKFVGVGTNDSYGGLIDNVSVFGMPSVEEDDLRNPVPVFTSASLPVSFGADGPGEWTGLTLNTLVESQDFLVALESGPRLDGAWYGMAGGREVFKVDVDVDAGTYTFTLLDQLDHGIGSDLMKLDFGFTVTDGDGDPVSGTLAVGVFDSEPLAQDDLDTVAAYLGRITEGNVITGIDKEPSAYADLKADYPGQDEVAKVITVRHGDDEVSFDNPGDVQTDSDGRFVSIEGEHGVLRIMEDGSYKYEVTDAAEPIVVSTPNSGVNTSGVVGAWDAAGVNVSAWRVTVGGSLTQDRVGFGTKDVSGTLDDGTPYAYSGLGVRSNGVLFSDSESEADLYFSALSIVLPEVLRVEFDEPMSKVTFELSALFNGVENDSGNIEKAQWTAFGKDGSQVAQGVVEGSLDGLVSHTILASLPIERVEFMPLDNGANNRGDNSDFMLRSISAEPAAQDLTDEFTYVIRDADGDTSSATLTINDVITLEGTEGSDTFVWNSMDDGAITNFELDEVASGGDVLDLSDLLDGSGATNANLGDYLGFGQNENGNTVITIDPNGTAAGDAGPTITLDVAFSDLQGYAGGTGTEADIISKLLTNQNLKVDG